MERLETMLIEFYTLKNLIGDISIPLDPSEQIKCVLTAKLKKDMSETYRLRLPASLIIPQTNVYVI